MNDNRLLEARLHELHSVSVPHECTSSYCDPQNELTLIRRGLLKGPAVLPEHLYLCRYGEFHSCSEDACMAEGPCRVSGASMGVIPEYNSYDPQNPKTWGVEEPRASTADVVYERVENIIENLLYSHVRERIEKQTQSSREKLYKKYIGVYKEECREQGIPVNLVHVAMLEPERDSHTRKLVRDPERISDYVHLVLRLLEHVQRLAHGDENICIETLTVGLLYKMQQGCIIDGIALVPRDVYLASYLPLGNDLPKFGIQKTKIVTGDNLIMRMYEQAQKRGMSVSEIAL